MENPNANQDLINEVYRFASYLMIKENKNAVEAKQALINKGLDEKNASIVVTRIEQQIQDAIDDKKCDAKEEMIYGAVWCIGGILVTVVTYIGAVSQGVYIITWGAILYGAIRFIRGLILYFSK